MNYAQTAATFRGMEGKASYDLWHTQGGILSVTALGDIVRATLAGGSNVPRIPPWRIGGGLNWTGDVFDAGFQVMRVAEQDEPGLFDTPTPGYVSIDAQIAWRPFAANRNIEFALSGHNLADEVVRNAASLNKDLVIGTGRSIRFAVKYATN
jgi:iron complex outermembrane receptor protein